MFQNMTKYLYVSKYALQGHLPENGTIGVFPGENIIWTTGILHPNQFVVKSYEFTEFIYFVDFEDIHLLKNWNLSDKNSHVIVRGCNDERERDALLILYADIMLNIHVYFSDDVSEQLRHLRKF